MADTATFLLIEKDPDERFLIERSFLDAPSHARLEELDTVMKAVLYVEGRGEYADRSKYPLPHLIILDLDVAGSSGFDFLGWLRSYKRDNHRLLPIVVISSSSSDEDITRAYQYGVNAYLTKPKRFNLFRDQLKALAWFWAEHVKAPPLHEP